MLRPSPLPVELSGQPFTVGVARELGVGRGRLAGSDLGRPFHGVRTPDAFFADSDDPLVLMCLQYAPRLAPWQFFWGETALALVGLPTPRWPHRVGLHVAAHRPAREPRTQGVIGHRLQVREPAIVVHAGMPLEHPVRAWRQAGSLWRHDDLVVAADAIVHQGWGTVEELRDEVRMLRGRSATTMRSALNHVRAGVESPEETRLRLLIVRAGLPEPEVNWILRDAYGRAIARLDLAYRRWRVAVEYDGRVHAEDVRQFERDADRWSAIRRAGWRHVRILRHHMRGDRPTAVALVREALHEAGWRP
ncbi:hypothetical protein NQ152_10685 [Microbacterium sp. zg.B48]|uniref:hypothetical protein n=1 Tax=Microbacterium sp. zg.B48 TaxID=2969408 RepID=UPI00214AF4AB|nr:hypothetical protein [Microbacterium sp. zg.B48]MCR2763968.1 hypothetical protein [Microbacterium sp. zg.B48]